LISNLQANVAPM